MRRSEACGRARVGKSSGGSEMMDSGIEIADCEHLADRRYARRRIARHGEHVRYLAASSRRSFHRQKGWWRTGRTGSPGDFSYSNQSTLLLSLDLSSIKPVRPVRHHPILWISLAFRAYRSRRSSVRRGTPQANSVRLQPGRNASTHHGAVRRTARRAEPVPNRFASVGTPRLSCYRSSRVQQ